MNMIILTIEQSLIFLPLVLGIYFIYRILGITDLTVDGSFVLGAGSFAKALSLKISPFIATPIGFLAGMIAGCGVAFIQRDNKVGPLIAGILALFILQSLNLLIMGTPNINLFSYKTLANFLSNIIPHSDFFIIILLNIPIILFLVFFFKSKIGLLFRGLGENLYLIKKMGFHIDKMKAQALAISNGFAALSGILSAQNHGFADLHMGYGVTLIGIGAVVIGHELVNKIFIPHKFSIYIDIMGCFLGTFLYFFTLNMLLKLGVESIYLKLLIGILLIIFLRTTYRKPTN